ncbi:beta-ketoacyl synthase, partial [Collybia nuda]
GETLSKIQSILWTSENIRSWAFTSISKVWRSAVMGSISPPIHLPIFAGQGTTSANAPQTRQQALLDASSASGSTLLSACHEAFLTELSTLSATDLDMVDVNLTNFRKKESLLAVPDQKSYFHNPVISGPTLFLMQSLRYLAFVEETSLSTDSLTPFSDILKRNVDNNIGVLGFSSGILSACVVSTSLSTLAYISRAVEAYRLAIWIGVRTQIYRRRALESSHLDTNTALPWSLVFLGMNKAYAETSIRSFNKDLETPSLYITAIMDDTCVTISGRPDILSAFSSRFAQDFSVHKTTLDTLYHSQVHVGHTREQVLADVASRHIHFPDFLDIKVPLRSTMTGEVITKDNATGSLLELVVDMVLTQPVNWNLVVEKVLEASPGGIPIRLLNIGPGAGLTRSLERAFPHGRAISVDLTAVNANRRQETRVKQEPIAIIGMAVNMPGAPNVSKLWEILEQGINTVSEVPDHRFKVSDYNDAKNPQRAMKAHTGNFVDGADEFDNKFFKISPREARSMDPQQRVLLHTAYEALEDSGYVPNSTPTSKPESFGCYIGAATHDYLQNLRNDIDVYYSTGTLKAFLSGRISYAMQLSGPSVVVDTACSASNVALYQGARALMNRDCDSAMVGGVNIISSPDMFLGLDRGHFLSPTGQCKAFDASADGYSRGEGCGIFILKRLSDALAENDRILGVIRGIEINQSGLAHSITHPHAPTQASLFKRILENSNIDADRVNIVEAHGTGTQAGDPNELESIRSVFATKRSLDNPLQITSIKANIGHLEAASGAAGLAKLLLMLQHKTIPQQISLKNLNPRIAPLESDNTVIHTASAPWYPSHEGKTRVALLNNFGAAGSNTALLIEEHPQGPSASQNEGMHYVFGLSAKDKSALEELRSRYVRYLSSAESSDASIHNIAYTSTARRQLFDYRISVSARNKEDLAEKLGKASIVHTTSKNAQAVFVFSGQGGQYLGMGQSLYQTTPLFRHHVDECHDFLVAAGFPGVRAILTPGARGSGLSALEEFEAYQAAIFTLEYSLAQLWMSWGLVPAAVVGHSLGEYAALVIANVLSLEGALTLVANRVRFMVQKCAVNSTGMIAVNTGSDPIERILEASEAFSDLSIACINSPIDCVVAGPLSQLKALKQVLDGEARCKNVLLTVPFGYHSPAMAPLLDDLTAVAGNVTLCGPTIPVVSNVLGSVVLPGDTSAFTPSYFSRHCSEPVRFTEGIRALTTIPEYSSIDAWIEIGPHTSTLPMLKSNDAVPRETLLLGSIRKQQEPWATLTNSLSQLYTSSFKLHWRKVFSHLEALTCISLPSYPFSKAKFWVAFKEDERIASEDPLPQTVQPQSLITEYPMLHAWVQWPTEENDATAIFETPIKQLAPSIVGHNVGGMPLCPASVYLEQIFSGINLAHKHRKINTDNSHVVLRNIEFAKPLVYDEAVDRTIITTVTVQDGSGTFSISSRVHSSSEESIHVHGRYRSQSTLQTMTKFGRTLPVISRRMAAVVHPTSEVFSTRTAYEIIFPRVVDYSREYRTIQSITVDASGMEGCADVRLPLDHDRGNFVVHPVFTDTLLHVAGFVANMQGGINDAYICSQVGSMKVIPHLINTDSSYLVYCSNAWVPEDELVLAEAYAVEAGDPRRIVAHIKGMAFRRVRLDRFKKGLAHAAGKRSSPQTSVDKKSPVAASFRQSSNTTSNSLNFHQDIMQIISETCGIDVKNVDTNTDLASLGVDSLMTIEILGKLENIFPDLTLNVHTLSFCSSVSDFIREISAMMKDHQSDDCDTTHSSGRSSPRTLVMDDKLVDPPLLAMEGENGVKQILASVLDISPKDLGDDVVFDSLGLDSLTSIEALYTLKNEVGLDLPSNFFTNYPTVRAVQTYISSSQAATKHAKTHSDIDVNTAIKILDNHANSNSLIKSLGHTELPMCLQESSTGRIPLFLIHDGSGLVNYYNRLSFLDRPTWGIYNPHFATAQPWNSVVQMATSYADYVSSQTSGPVILGGWSFGGVAAYETALQLSLRGIRVQGLLLVDSPSPINHVPLSSALIDTVLRSEGHNTNSELGRLMRAQFAMNAQMLGEYDAQATSGVCPSIVLLRSKDGYKPSGVQDVPQWLADRTNVTLATTGWETLSGTSPKVIDIPGHHFQPFHPSNIRDVSQRIAEACEHLERL